MSTGATQVNTSAQQAELRRTISHPSNNSIYRPKQDGLKFPELPDFPTFAQERQHRKERLVAACHAFALHHLDYGFAGHLTVRDPEFPDMYWTNPMAVHFSQVRYWLILSSKCRNPYTRMPMTPSSALWPRQTKRP